MARKPVISIMTIVEYFEDKKLIRKGENSYNSSHVQKVAFDGELHMIRAEVLPSMKNRNYKVEVSINDGEIELCSCNCPRGLGLCHHMCALAFFAHYNVSVTDIACQWSIRKSKDCSAKTAEDCFPSPAFANFKPMVEEITDIQLQEFHQKLKECGSTGICWLLSPEPENVQSVEIANIEKIIFSQEYHLAIDKTSFLKEKCKLDETKIIQINALTENQAANSLWLIARKNRVTASNFGNILRACRRGKFPPSLFKSLTGSYNLDGINQIQWGKQHENDAIMEFQEKYKVKVNRSGIWLTSSGIIGASPDGLVEDNGVVEVKCPFKFRDMTFNAALTTEKNYIIQHVDGEYLVNKNHNYYHQIQGQLHVTKRDVCYLVLWTNLDLLVKEIYKEREWKNNMEILESFYFNYYIPYLLNNNVK